MPDLPACKRYLRMLEEHAMRRAKPAYVASGALIARQKQAKLTKREVCEYMETRAIASLDLGDVATASDMIANLYAEFPASHRVARLEGMRLEALGDFDAATRKYDEILKESPADQRCVKRKAACLRAQGKADAAIEVLCEYLDTFMGDFGAWEALAGWYAERGSFAQSVFCWEEVVVAQPMMAHHHRRLAEVYYTWGGEENLRCARKYYAAALDMSGGSDVRALYGLALADRRLRRFETKRSKEGSGSGSIDAGGEGVDALGADAAAFLQKFYAAACPELLPIVEKQMADARK